MDEGIYFEGKPDETRDSKTDTIAAASIFLVVADGCGQTASGRKQEISAYEQN